MADFNGDGKPDLAVSCAGDSGNGYAASLLVLLGDGKGGFTALSVQASTNGFSVATGDFDGDGKPDLAISDPTSIEVLLGNGDGTFASPQSFTVNYGAGVIAVEDVNGDGKPDLVTTSSGNSVSVLLNTSK